MELRQLRYFAQIVESGSFTAAASQLRLAQPSLSAVVAKLEIELGVSLLHRTARGVEPTAAGRHLLEAGNRLLGEADDLAASTRRFGEGLAGVLTIAAVPVLMWHRVPELLRVHAAEAPGVEIRLVDPPPWEAIELLRERAVDVAAINVADPRRFAARHRSDFEIVDWGEIPLVAALPPGESVAPGPLPLAAFNGRTVLLPYRAAGVPSLPEAVAEAFERHGVVPGVIRTVETIQAGVPLVEAGLAAAILPDPDRRSLERFQLIVRDLDPAPRPLRSLVLARSGASSDPLVRRLLQRVASA